MKLKITGGKQGTMEVLNNHFIYKNKPEVVSSIQKNIIRREPPIAGPVLRSPYLTGYAVQSSNKEAQSPALEEMAALGNKALEPLQTHLDLKEISVGAEARFSKREKTLQLSPEGLVGAALFTQVFKSDMGEWSPTIKTLMREGELKNATSESAAAGFLFLHLATHGIDGIFMDLRLDTVAIQKCLYQKNTLIPTQVQGELYKMQIRLAAALSDGLEQGQ